MPLDPSTPPLALLDRVGPDARAPIALTPAEAIAYCRGLATSHYENFSVLSSLVPERLRDDFAAVYAFCRWSDDLADETGADDAARARSLELLAWWRGELTGCFDDSPPHHPVFTALRTTRARHPHLSARPFHDLLDAFVQDQHVRAYDSWPQVLDYCTRSANPVGRIVLALAGHAHPEMDERSAPLYEMSDATCTALQLINFWQDVRRDLLERDRVYIPRDETGITPEILRDWVNKGDDPRARVPFIRALTPLVDQTAELFAKGRALPAQLDPGIAPVVWLFGAGGEAILSAVRRTGNATLWQRPRLSRPTKLSLVMAAWAKARIGSFSRS